MRLLNRFSTRIALSLIGITVGTVAIFTLFLIGLTQLIFVPDTYRMRAMVDVTAWQFDDPLMYDALGMFPAGFSLIVNETQEVVYVDGAAPCRVGDVLLDCAAELANLPTGQEQFLLADEEWTQLVLDIKTGERVITQRGPVGSTLNLGFVTVEGIPGIIAAQTLITVIIALPLVLLMSVVLIRPLVLRLSAIAATSRQFANGDFDARILDPRPDEIGQLSQQFDDMADTIQKNFQTLQELAEQNATLAKHAEATAKQNERLRLSRDLHDTIAQRLFSLSMMASTLPNLIPDNTAAAGERAQAIAHLAEETQQDLRALLIDLRPSSILAVGFADAVRQLVQTWGRNSNIETDITLMVHDDAIPAVVQDTLYRITAEALNNIAKHAQATEAAVTLVMGSQQIALSIVDNGRGFANTAEMSGQSLGLYGMRERARAIGGQLQIDSNQAGTSIQLTLLSS